MKLEKYIEQAILDITNGVAAAQKQSYHWIAPGSLNGKKISDHSSIEFEIAVTVNGEGSGSIDVFSLGKPGGAASTEHVNKVSFSVPVYFQAPKIHPKSQ